MKRIAENIAEQCDSTIRARTLLISSDQSQLKTNFFLFVSTA